MTKFELDQRQEKIKNERRGTVTAWILILFVFCAAMFFDG